MRDLAKVCTISSVNKMFEKDRIVWVTLNENGYEYIMPSTTKVGDKVVVIGEDSILPIEDKWEFLRKRCYRQELNGFLIRPMTMGAKDLNGEKGERVKSWGLCVTLSEAGLSEGLKAGLDVTDKLGIRKYEPEEDASPKTSSKKIPSFIKFCMRYKATRWISRIYMKLFKGPKNTGSFPTDIISKSDETTIQNYKSVLNDFAGKKAFITCKMEGQSFSCSLDPKCKYKMYVCSRNNRLIRGQENSSPFYDVADRYDLENKLKAYYKKNGILLMLQGEQVGPGIQNNIYRFNEVRWFLFRMKGLEKGKWIEYNYPKMLEIAKELNLECVPLFEVVEDMSKYLTYDEETKEIHFSNSIKNLVDLAESAYWKPNKDGSYDFTYVPKEGEKLWKDYCQHEGLVVKSFDYNKEESVGFSFKVKNLTYAEKELKDIAKVTDLIKNR